MIILILSFKVKKDNKYINIKQVLKEEFLISDRLLLKLKNNKQFFLNDKIVYVSHPVNENDIITVNLDFKENSENIVSTKMNLNILYEDSAFLILNKPAGIAIHPSHSHFSTSLSNGVKYYFEKIGLKRKIRPVNRLDKDTSGIVIFAKNEYIQECLVRQMKNNIFIKEYIALLCGHIKNQNGTIKAPIARESDSIIKRCVRNDGDVAISHYKVLKEYDSFSKVQFIIETGRTHQIRVHSSYIGNPVLGDTLYGTASSLISRQALHSYKVSFIHPLTKEHLEITAPLFEDMKSLINEKR